MWMRTPPLRARFESVASSASKFVISTTLAAHTCNRTHCARPRSERCSPTRVARVWGGTVGEPWSPANVWPCHSVVLCLRVSCGGYTRVRRRYHRRRSRARRYQRPATARPAPHAGHKSQRLNESTRVLRVEGEGESERICDLDAVVPFLPLVAADFVQLPSLWVDLLVGGILCPRV